MSSQSMIRVGLVLLTGAAALGACSGDDGKPPTGFDPDAQAGAAGIGGTAGDAGSSGSGGSSGAGKGGSAGLDGSSEGSGGTGGVSGFGGVGGGSDAGPDGDGAIDDPEPGTCGNGSLEPGEGCEAKDEDIDFGGKTCQSFGYSQGNLVCLLPRCAIDISKCSGTERCANGRSDDGDAFVDCDDSDCAKACADACSMPEIIPDPSTIQAKLAGHTSKLAPSCYPTSAGGIVYQVTAAVSGVLDVTLTSGADLNLSVRTSCSSSGSELGCSDGAPGIPSVERLRVPVTQGQKLFVVVAGSGQSGDFKLELRSRTVRCGDFHRDLTEQCDDGNKNAADGCSSQCQLEPSEVEQNGTIGQANAYTGTYAVGSISPAKDMDVYSVPVIAANSMIRARTTDFGDAVCAENALDSYVEILNASGTVLAADDDSGVEYCSLAEAWGLPVGQYFVRVSASDATPTFSYKLLVTVQ
jgi:cysteine-rich repeat protein